MREINIYIDGACSGNGKTNSTGGWGVVIYDRPDCAPIETCGGQSDTTNQRMELMACVKALVLASIRYAGSERVQLRIHSDSAYLVNCMTQGWYKKWQMNGWTTARGTQVDNKDLWEQIITLVKQHHLITFHKVAGHSGIPGNVRADEMAQRGKLVMN